MTTNEARIESRRRWADREDVGHLGISLRTKRHRDRCTLWIRFVGADSCWHDSRCVAAAPTWEEMLAKAASVLDGRTADEVIAALDRAERAAS